jgi:hypothetical protein
MAHRRRCSTRRCAAQQHRHRLPGPALAVVDERGQGESAWGAVTTLPSFRFPRPLTEPAVRLSTQRALHGMPLPWARSRGWGWLRLDSGSG